MQIILLERVPKLGQMGEVVNVKPGYARNFLIPHGKALRATKASIGDFEKRRAQLEAHNLERKQDAQAMAAKVDGQMRHPAAAGQRDQPALRLGQRARHRRGLHRGRDHAGAAADPPRPAAEDPGPARRHRGAAPRGRGDGQGQHRPLRRPRPTSRPARPPPAEPAEEEERELTLEEELAALI